ncbi:YdcF family protein [Cupriavidus sp. D384]|uniref:YdcF family protein n=1 Tax=Cupriavidus sp. D384 TaxID=1538095 RepID=UPI00083714FF|nr:YdcF family protein [Cupriavidus sp. D384]
MANKSKGWRIAMALPGSLLLGDALMLAIRGVMNFGVVVPGVLGLAALALAARWDTVARWRRTHPGVAWLWCAGWALLIVWLISVAIFFRFLSQGAHAPITPEAATQPPAAILVLGSGSPNCEVSPTLKARLDVGLALARQWPAAPVVVSGGRDFGGLDCTEAGLMADYLTSQGLPPQRVLREDRSTSTDENMRFSRRVLEQHGIGADAALVMVTSDFHLPRAGRIARKAGFGAVSGVAAPTPLYVRYNAWLREYFAYISGWMLGEY